MICALIHHFVALFDTAVYVVTHALYHPIEFCLCVDVVQYRLDFIIPFKPLQFTDEVYRVSDGLINLSGINTEHGGHLILTEFIQVFGVLQFCCLFLRISVVK